MPIDAEPRGRAGFTEALGSVWTKLGLRDRTPAAIFACETGLVRLTG